MAAVACRIAATTLPTAAPTLSVFGLPGTNPLFFYSFSLYYREAVDFFEKGDVSSSQYPPPPVNLINTVVLASDDLHPLRHFNPQDCHPVFQHFSDQLTQL
jgi:hypothetical protein